MMKVLLLIGMSVNNKSSLVVTLGVTSLAMGVLCLGVEMEEVESLRFTQGALTALTFWLTSLMIMGDYFLKRMTAFTGVLKVLTFFLVLSFMVKSLMFYYYCFECSLLPVFMLILGWGYQPERMEASLYMLFYTITASLPLLMVLLILSGQMGSTDMSLAVLSSYSLQSSFSLMLVAAFMVKFPLYLAHLWLPKAHVEAPVSGSMILAGVLLKLGGYGLIIMVSLILKMTWISGVILSVAMIGSGGLAIMILRLTDLKVAIAYSSVVHMAMIIGVFLGVSPLGLVGGVWMLLAHGFTSSGMFSGANMMYERSHSRSLVVNKGVLTSAPFFSMVWFMIAVLNFAGPFTLNLFSEILMIQSLMKLSLFTSVPVFLLCFFSAAYNLNIYASSQQGKSFSGGALMEVMSGREMLVLSAHIWPCVLLLGGLLM